MRGFRYLGNVAARQYVQLREFGPEVVEGLLRRGFAVVDDVLSCDSVRTLRDEVRQLHHRGVLRSNETHFAGSGTECVRVTKPGVHECELHLLDAKTRETVPGLCKLEDDTTFCTLLSVYAPRLTLREQALKAQRSAGDGACFPLHVDSASNVDARQVTAVVYLNNEWEGGQLRVYPYPDKPVNIEPVAGRAVLLAAQTMVHRVLPSFQERFALTLWLSGSMRRSGRNSGTLNVANDDVETIVARALLAAEVRPYLARLALANDWDTSLREAHGTSDSEAAIEMHRNDRIKILNRLPRIVARSLPDGDKRREDAQSLCSQLLRTPEMLRETLLEHASAKESSWL